MADLREGTRERAPPLGGPNSFNFMQFLGKYGKIVCWRPPGELAPPPRKNPGSATVIKKLPEMAILASKVFTTEKTVTSSGVRPDDHWIKRLLLI